MRMRLRASGYGYCCLVFDMDIYTLISTTRI
jgi:hypothetical protein